MLSTREPYRLFADSPRGEHRNDHGGGRTGVEWRRAEFGLTLLALLGFLTLPIRITTIYSGLPAHPLFVHVPVVLIPITILVAVLRVVLVLLSIGAGYMCSGPADLGAKPVWQGRIQAARGGNPGGPGGQGLFSSSSTGPP